jgi:dTDP-4-amino-4,6-dideoxygalactose transaminase
MSVIPVLRPKLPSANQIAPYLRRIDSRRIYTNFGPLTAEFEARLSQRLLLRTSDVVSASCGTMALVGTLLAVRVRSGRPLAVLPSFTFAATAIAVERAGFTPYFVDVDPETWALDSETLIEQSSLLAKTAVVVPVAPFGRPVPLAPWLAFQRRTGIPVVIDAAAGFACTERDPADYVGAVPAVFSFHATKGFGIGEGGGIACTDRELVWRVTRALNFGFHDGRESEASSVNGKMSEYHAAVGLALLDQWKERCDAMQRVADTYRVEFARFGLGDRFVGYPNIDGAYALYIAGNAQEAKRIVRELKAAEIDYRFWYGAGVHVQRHFDRCPRSPLPETEALAPLVIGLPTAPDLSAQSIRRVVTAVTEGSRVRRRLVAVPALLPNA